MGALSFSDRNARVLPLPAGGERVGVRGRCRLPEPFVDCSSEPLRNLRTHSDSLHRRLTPASHSRCFASAFLVLRTASQGRLRSPRTRGEVKRAISFSRRAFCARVFGNPRHESFASKKIRGGGAPRGAY